MDDKIEVDTTDVKGLKDSLCCHLMNGDVSKNGSTSFLAGDRPGSGFIDDSSILA